MVAKATTLTTTQTAAVLEIAPSSVGRLHSDGLSGAVWRWGAGRGQQTLYSREHVERFRAARACLRRRRCEICAGVIAGLQITGQHFAVFRHGLKTQCDGPCCFSDGRTCDEQRAGR